MFSNENKMGGLSLLYESPSIDAILEWGKKTYNDKNLEMTSPSDGVRYFFSDTSKGYFQYASCIIQENKRYKVYG